MIGSAFAPGAAEPLLRHRRRARWSVPLLSAKGGLPRPFLAVPMSHGTAELTQHGGASFRPEGLALLWRAGWRGAGRRSSSSVALRCRCSPSILPITSKPPATEGKPRAPSSSLVSPAAARRPPHQPQPQPPDDPLLAGRPSCSTALLSVCSPQLGRQWGPLRDSSADGARARAPTPAPVHLLRRPPRLLGLPAGGTVHGG